MSDSAADQSPGPALRWVRALDGSRDLSADLVGGKARSVNWMRTLGLPVPPAATLTTEAFARCEARGTLPEAVWEELLESIRYLEQASGRTFGSGPAPLLISVRSGAAQSMPGMMDTILNLGINTEVADVLAAETGDAGFAQRTLALFRNQFRELVLAGADAPVPEDVRSQLREAVQAVLASWHSPRARAYREHYDIDGATGTSVTLQAMVFGNRDERSGSGVLFTRNPATGARRPYGQWLTGAQGEDVVSGRVDPDSLETLADAMPALYADLMAAGEKLEAADKDIQDIEFTIESGRLWLLQARRAKRSPLATVNVAVQLSAEGVIDSEEALRRISPAQVRQLLKPGLDPSAVQDATVVAAGEPACPGIASGTLVVCADDALDREGVVLARPTTSPDDIHGMLAARAVVTELGGATSHAAVVSREIGVPCVVGCGRDSLLPLAGETVTVDGTSGNIYWGELPLVSFREDQDLVLRQLADWAQARVPVAIRHLDTVKGENPTDIGRVDSGIEARLSGLRAAKGAALETDDGVRLALDAGVETLYVRQRLPALLAAWVAMGQV